MKDLCFRWDSARTKLGGIKIKTNDDFKLPSDTYPNYGTRLGLTYGEPFRPSLGGALVKRGVVKLTENERSRLGHKTCWMEGLFLAEKLPCNAYVMDYDGVKRRVSQVHGTDKEDSAEYRKFRTHVLKVGRVLVDASDTKRFAAGLLNTCPGGANSCAVRGKTVTLKYPSPVNTMLCINYGKSYNTKDFVRFKCFPLNELQEKQKQEELRKKLMMRICSCNKPKGDRKIVRCANSMPDSEKRNRKREQKVLERKRKDELTRRNKMKEKSVECVFCLCKVDDSDDVILRCLVCKIVSCHASCCLGEEDNDKWVCKRCKRKQRRVEKEKKKEKKKKEKKKHVYCEVEEFHMDCVGLKKRPRGRKWYCKDCVELYPKQFRHEEEKPSLKNGLRVSVYWHAEKKWYRGKVSNLKRGSVEIQYADGDVHIHPLEGLLWRKCALAGGRKKIKRVVD